MRTTQQTLLLALLALAGACLPIQKLNKAPDAVVVVTMGGQLVNTDKPIPFDGTPVTVVLDGSHSTDTDGEIVEYRWMRTDVPVSARQPGAAMVDAGTAPAFTADPAPGAMSQITLTEKGKYRFTLWARDNEGAYSKPASVKITLGGFTPDMACAMSNTDKARPDCVACTCTPNAMGGCLDEYKRCFNNADAMYTTLCSAVITCGLAKKCSGAGCYTAANCMAEIDAASTYMGGTLADCQAPAMAATSPCAGSATLATCQTMSSMCTMVCK